MINSGNATAKHDIVMFEPSIHLFWDEQAIAFWWCLVCGVVPFDVCHVVRVVVGLELFGHVDHVGLADFDFAVGGGCDELAEWRNHGFVVLPQ